MYVCIIIIHVRTSMCLSCVHVYYACHKIYHFINLEESTTCTLYSNNKCHRVLVERPAYLHCVQYIITIQIRSKAPKYFKVPQR